MSIFMANPSRRTVLVGIGAAAGALSAPAVLRAQTRPAKITIGALCSLSGLAATFGASAKSAFEVRIQEINKSGGIWGDGTGMIDLAITDDQSKAEIAVSEIARFARNRDTIAIVSLIPSGGMMQGTIEAERQNIVMVNAGSVAKDINERGLKHTITTSNNTEGYVRAYLEYTKEIVQAQPPKKVALIYENKFAGASYKAAWDALYSQLVDWGPAQVYAYDPSTTTDFAPLVAKLQSDGIDFPVLSTYPQDTILLIRAMKEQRYNPLAISGFYGALPTAEVVTALGKDAEFIMGQAPYLYDLKVPGGSAFVESFKAQTGKLPDSLAGLSYNAMSGLIAAIKRSKNPADRAALRESMSTLDIKVGQDNVIIPDGIKINEKGANPSSKGGYYQIRSGILKAVRPTEFASTSELVYPRPTWDRLPG